jgi:hypothetical protein
MPLLAISVADGKLPTESIDGSTEKVHVTTTLEVKREYVFAITGALIGIQLFAISVVLYLCRNTFIRDGSFLSIARLFRTVMTKVEGGSLATGEGLARGLGIKVKYGTKLIDGKRIVDLADDVEDGFLSGPYEETPKEWQPESKYRILG